MRISPLLKSGWLTLLLMAGCATAKTNHKEVINGMTPEQETAVFITIGQSNADGSAEFDPQEDLRLRQWYANPDSNLHTMKMWYRSTYIENQPNDARWVMDGKVIDHEPGWLDLWYRNENDSGRTAMNMIHAYGTWSKSDDIMSAHGRRGMEGEFGRAMQHAYPGKEFYFIKLGCSGSQIGTWTGEDRHNWDYFYENIYKPAMSDLLAQGKKPRLAGIWWMQGCGDKSKDSTYYVNRLTELVDRCHSDLGFPDGKIYIGKIIAPGESPTHPKGSSQYGPGVRAAQMAVTTPGNPAYREHTEAVDSRNSPFQGDYLHFNHKGINLIGRNLAARVIADGIEGWAPFTTPGKWEMRGAEEIFVPAFGNPTITYSEKDGRRAAHLDYGTWNETIIKE